MTYILCIVCTVHEKTHNLDIIREQVCEYFCLPSLVWHVVSGFSGSYRWCFCRISLGFGNWSLGHGIIQGMVRRLIPINDQAKGVSAIPCSSVSLLYEDCIASSAKIKQSKIFRWWTTTAKSNGWRRSGGSRRCTPPPSREWRTWSAWGTSTRPASYGTSSSDTMTTSSMWVLMSGWFNSAFKYLFF